MKVLLTGSTGNIGSHTLPRLLDQGDKVRCLVRESTGNRYRARGLPSGVECHWGDIRDAEAVIRAVDGVDAVIHLAGVIPPASEEKPAVARETNVVGTSNIIKACLDHTDPGGGPGTGFGVGMGASPASARRGPRLYFVSTFDVHGHTLQKTPPRRVGDPLTATDEYTANKIECERMVRESGLTWSILRLSDVPVLGVRNPHPIMFEIGLHNRIEALHADDAGFALAAAAHTPQVLGRILFIGGGPSCQLTYREYLARMLAAMGIDPLPDEAFSTKEYATDWLDTEESQQLLHYQRHGFDDITADVAASLGWKRRLVPLAGPLARGAMLALSPYYRKAKGAAR